MEWLSNIYDPLKPDAQARLGKQWKRHLDWHSEHIVGRPKATERYTTEQLEVMGMIGIYARDEETSQTSLG